MMPRLGITTPKYEMPSFRYRLFRNAEKEAKILMGIREKEVSLITAKIHKIETAAALSGEDPDELNLPTYPPEIHIPNLPDLAYTESDMLSWYSPDELDKDDLAMIAAEKLGQKMRAYLEWLSKTAERVAQGRLDMLSEDKVANINRTYWNKLELKLNTIMEGNVAKVADLSFQDALPTTYQYIEKDTVHYEDG